MSDAVRARLQDPAWKTWGPYISERAWGTIREDYSANGDAWGAFPHDHARSRTFRWNEDGLAGICDDQQTLYLAFAFWNGRDPIPKERSTGRRRFPSTARSSSRTAPRGWRCIASTCWRSH